MAIRLGGKTRTAAPTKPAPTTGAARPPQPARPAAERWQPTAPTSPIESRLRTLETSSRPLSADELTGAFIELRSAAGREGVPRPMLDRFREVTERSLDDRLARARSQGGPTDIKAVYAEDLGKLLVLARGCVENRHQPPASLVSREDRVREFMTDVANARVADFRSLRERAATDPAGTIRDAETLQVSLEADLTRMRVYGFDPPRLDAAGLAQGVRQAAVNSFGPR